MEQIDLPSKTDNNVDLNLFYKCAACDFMTNSLVHLEKHTTIMHHNLPPNYITKVISESDYSSTGTKKADSLFALTHVDNTAGVNFPKVQMDDNVLHCNSTLKLECIDDGTVDDLNELKPNIKDPSNMLSGENDSFNSFNSSCVKNEVEHDDTIISDINQSTVKQEILLSSLSNCEVKGEMMNCQSCSYSDVDFDKLRFHKITQHPTEAAIITNKFYEKDINIHDITFFCIKEACSFTTTLCSVYEQHLLHCCSLQQNLTKIQMERLKSTITFILDLNNKLGLDRMSDSLDFVSLFNKIYAYNADQDKISKDLKHDSSSSLFNMSDSALLSDVKCCLNCDDVKWTSGGSLSAVPVSGLIVNAQNSDLSSSENCQTETMCEVKHDKHNKHLIETDMSKTKFPLSSKDEIINIDSSIDHLVSNNMELEIDIAGKPLYDKSALFSEEMRKDNVKDEVNVGTKCNMCGKIFTQENSHLMLKETHNKEKGCSCNCSQKFGRDNILLSYMRKDMEETRLICNECGKCFSERRNLTIHMKEHKGEKPYSCEECDKAFSKRRYLTIHMRVHTGERPYRCERCGKSFSVKNKLTVHMRVHTGEKPFKCSQCGKVFSQKGMLSFHMRLHTGEKPYKCKECGKAFRGTNSLAVHMRVHTGEKPFMCNECGKAFSQKGKLTAHIRIHTGEKPYMCNECGKGFTLKHILTIHMRVHTGEKPFKCNKCDKAFSQKHMLKLHMNVHTGEKLFKCIECGQSFIQKSTLTVHMRGHTGEKPFKCNECGKAFVQKSSLTVHLRVHTGEKPYSCKECGKAFSERRYLTIHMRVHTGEMPYKCEDCGKSFSVRNKLTTHLRVHTGEKPFKCSLCDKAFSQKSMLKVHVRLHTGEKPYRCKECGKAFRGKNVLTVHKRIHTGVKPFMCNECGKAFSKKHALIVHMRVHTGEKPFMCNKCGKAFCKKNKLTIHMRLHS